MRSDMQELGRGRLTATTRPQTRMAAPTSAASALDAALGESSAAVEVPRSARRDVRAAGAALESMRVSVDTAHECGAQASATSESGLLTQLSRQLASLEAQQRQIHELIAMAERRAGRN